MDRIGQPIVITGASTGIGRATAIHLDRLGFRVFAGVRKETDGRGLKETASDLLTPILLDVTDSDSIASAVRTVSQATAGDLFGLVNNAGLSLNGPLEMVPVAEVKKLMDVNVIGLLAVTQAFLPLLRKSPGRIVNISSGHGLLAIPDKSAYAASKFAVRAISDALRVELRPFGVSVSCLAVGKVDTAVLGKITADREKMISDADPETVEAYLALIEFFDEKVKSLPGINPEAVGKVVAKALMTDKPKPYYLVGPGARKMKNLARLPVGLRDQMLYKTIHSRRST
jgi:NAD(P)-dependent dehydrogenase (short-subunit alcohol dehydrogenase family)